MEEDEDYDLPNPVLDNPDFESPAHLNDLDSNQPKSNCQSIINKNQFYLVSFLTLNNSFGKKFVSNDSSLLLTNDRNFLLSSYLIISNLMSISNDSLKNLRFYLLLLMISFSFIVFYFVNSFAIYIFCMFVALFVLQFKLMFVLFDKAIEMASTHLNKMKSINYFLKEAELVHLANKRRYFIEINNNIATKQADYLKNDDQTKKFDINSDNFNYPFRQMTFRKFRLEFFKLKEANLKLVNGISKSLLDKLNMDKDSFICTINESELSEILQKESDQIDLNKITDHFSINCLKSLSKLNKYLISEHFKLIFLSYYSIQLTQTKNPIEIERSVLDLLFNMLKSRLLLNDLNRELESLMDLCKLIDQSTIVETILENDLPPKIQRSEKFEHHLSLHLRNALLNCYKLKNCSESKDNYNGKQVYFYLKCDLEYCDFYFKQISNIYEDIQTEKIEKLNDEQTSKNTKSPNENPPKVIIIDSQPNVLEDEILEADTFDLIDNENQPKNPSTIEDDQIDQETNLANKNLFYELKYALKFKKNEWTQREKLAKRINDGKDDCESREMMNHLLENDTFKYKCELRRRRLKREEIIVREKSGWVEEEKFSRRKYVYESSEAEDSEDESESKIPFNPFLNELMLKRNAFLNNKNIEEELFH